MMMRNCLNTVLSPAAAATWMGIALLLLATSTSASVFDNDLRWPTGNDGYAIIPVCIVPGSSTEQRKGRTNFISHARNPSLEEVVEKVRGALSSGWEAHSALRFVDWRACDLLTFDERSEAIGMYIHPDAPNKSGVGINTKGRAIATQFKPWGIADTCLEFSFFTWRYEYRFDCVETLALHEFGHAIGLRHEWYHPLTPESCFATRGQTEQPLGVDRTSPLFGDEDHTVINPDTYDWNSIMTYTEECADGEESYFGSAGLSPDDILGVMEVYPPPSNGLSSPETLP